MSNIVKIKKIDNKVELIKRLNRNRSVFPTKSSLEKALFLSVEKISKKWTYPIRNWGSIFKELSIMVEERISY